MPLLAAGRFRSSELKACGIVELFSGIGRTLLTGGEVAGVPLPQTIETGTQRTGTVGNVLPELPNRTAPLEYQ